MIVYIDVLIIINVYVTYFTIRAASRLLHTKLSLRRTAAAAVLGGFSALAALLDINIALSLLIKTALTVIITLTAFGFGSIKLLIIRSFVCTAAGMLICGAAVLLHEFAGTDIIFSANGYLYLDVSALVLVISSAVIYAALAVMRRIFDSPHSDSKITLTVKGKNGKTAVLTAIPDSGNYLKDFLTGRPVIICRTGAINEIIPENVSAYLGGSTDDMRGIRLIPMKTAAGNTIAAAFTPESITASLDGREKQLDALIAAMNGAFENEGFDALISDKLLT